MIVYNCDQMTDRWFEIKAGVPSAGSLGKIVTSKGELSKQRQDYLYQLAGEKIIGRKQETYQSEAMRRGIEMEAEARAYYEFLYDAEVNQIGFCLSDHAGCSPDGLIGEDGGLEIKCPDLKTHIEYIIKDRVPPKYFQQVQGSLFVTGREWWDFMSYYPGIKPLIVRCYPDEKFMSKLEIELMNFNSELQKVVEAIQ